MSSGKVPRCEVCAMKVDMKNVPKYEKEGYMWKQGGQIKSWKQRWFILYGKHIAYYEKDENTSRGKLTAKGCIHIHSVKCEPTKHSKHPPPHAPFFLHANERSFLLVAPTVAERNLWMNALKRVNDRPPAIFCAPCQRLVDLSRCATPERQGEVSNSNSGKKNYLVLAQGHLAYYNDKEDVGQKMALNLVHLNTNECFVTQKSDKEFEIKLKVAGDTIKFTSKETAQWVHAINAAILADDDDDMLIGGAAATATPASDSDSDSGGDAPGRRPSRDRRAPRGGDRDRYRERERIPRSSSARSPSRAAPAAEPDEFADIIIEFLTSCGGSATTADIMNHFKSRVGKDQSTAFSLSLSRVSKFDKVSKQWKLK
mmetsp:Transcript_13871/g.23914  ORF Transcript_13871/g.23914 Transcript_13871/m.23914 type:complete len:370 (-) Transcript_13871:18-1127(-)